MTGVIGIVLILSLLKTSNASNVARYTIEPSLYSALNNFALAQETAKTWQPDVQFVSAAARWEQPSVGDLTAPIEWFYRFYSQEQQRYLFVIVTPDQAVIARPHISRTFRESRVINAELWAVDSPEALTTWLNEGNGGLWLNQSSNVVVSAQLGLDPEIDEPVWVVSVTNPDSGQSDTHAISALAKPEVSSNPFERLAGSILSSLRSEP